MQQYVALQNFSHRLTDTDLAPIAVALKTQVQRDFSQHYGIFADVRVFSASTVLPPNAWSLGFFDNSDQANALGYHEVNQSGNPLGKVFVEDDIASGVPHSLTASHELLEMLVDPYVCLCSNHLLMENGLSKLRLYAYEVADACEDKQFGYLINDVLVSDFVLPRWFDGAHTPNANERFDFCGHVQKPLQLLPGGYIGIYDSWLGIGWKPLYPSDSSVASSNGGEPNKEHRRLNLRKIPRSNWCHSNPTLHCERA